MRPRNGSGPPPRLGLRGTSGGLRQGASGARRQGAQEESSKPMLPPEPTARNAR
jgi:hypothetical protein